MYRDYPAGSGFGRDPNPKLPSPIDGDLILQIGNRQQRRYMLRQLQRLASSGVSGAAEGLAAAQRAEEIRSGKNLLARFVELQKARE